MAGMAETGAGAFVDECPGEGRKRKHVHVVEIGIVGSAAAVQVSEKGRTCFSILMGGGGNGEINLGTCRLYML